MKSERIAHLESLVTSRDAVIAEKEQALARGNTIRAGDQQMQDLLRRLGSANAQQGKRITELTQQIAQLFRSQQSDQMQPQPAAMQALPPPPVVQALPPPPVAYNTHEAQARSRAPSMEAQALSAESQLPSAFPGLFALPIRLANGTSKHWTDVKKDEKVDTATMRPSYWFECLEEKTRGGQKLTRQLLLFSDGIALVNNAKFKWYRRSPLPATDAP